MKVIYSDGTYCGAVDAASYERLDGTIRIAESYRRPFRGTPDKLAEDVLFHIHCPLSAEIIGEVSATDEQGDFLPHVLNSKRFMVYIDVKMACLPQWHICCFWIYEIYYKWYING